MNKKEETKQLILRTARDIMTREGIEQLSIRKITNTLDYSPGIVYHYFKDKNEIVETLLKEGYGKILSSLRAAKIYEDDPEREIREGFTGYLHAILEFSEDYKAFILSSKPSILQHTGMLHEGVSKDRKSLQILCNSIRKGIQLNLFAECDVELTAQVLWVSIFGLAVRLIIEGEIDIEQRERLIGRQLDILINGLKYQEK